MKEVIYERVHKVAGRENECIKEILYYSLGGYAVARYFDGAHKTKNYKRLLPALRYIERGPR